MAALPACGASRGSEPAVPAESAAAAEGSTDRSGLPVPGPASVWAPPAPELWQLSGGARVYHRRHGSVPLVSLMLVLPRGSETDPAGKAGLSTLMADMLDEGAGAYSALELNERLQALATDYSASASIDSLTLSLHLIEENFQASVDLLADIVRRPRFDEKEFQRRKSQHIAQALASEADAHSGRRAAMYRALFGDGYASGLASGTRDTLETLTLADVKAQYQRTMVGEGAAFVVIGGIDRDEVNRELERAFGNWAGTAKVETQPLENAPGAGKLYFVDYPGAAQSVIGLVRRAPGVDAEDLFSSGVFSRSFGEAFTSRVNLNLREEKGYTYGAVSMFQRFRQAGFFGIFSDVRTDVTRASLDEVLKELSDVCGARPLSAAERDDAVSGSLLGYPASFESIGLVAGRFSQLPIHGRPLDWFTLWPSRVEAVTLGQANAAAKSYCQRSEFSIIVAGDKAKVQPTLDGLGFELVAVDARGRLL